MKTKKKKASQDSLVVISLKMTAQELKALKTQAKKHATSNLSAWLRYAGLRYIPRKGEVVVHRFSHLGPKRR